MRPFEILLALLCAACLAFLFFKSRPAWTRFLPAIALVVALAQLLIEGYRWQLVPLYALAIILFLAGLPFLAGKPARRRIVPAALGLLALAISVALPSLLPVPSLPEPSGPYRIGTTTMILVDQNRLEQYSGNPNEPRRIQVQVWYPATPAADAQPAVWMEGAEIVAPALAVYLDLPAFFLDHLALAHSDSYMEAPLDLSGGPYPVLIFSHGWNGFRAQSTFQMQELASHGYVVAAIDHTYGAVVTVFPDGQIAYNNPKALPIGAPTEEYMPAAHLLIRQWAGDIAFTLDQLTGLNVEPSSIFFGALDVTRVGVLGHSTGAGATVQFCGSDPRCTAVFPMDVYMIPVTDEVLDAGLTQPALFLFSETFPTEKNIEFFNRLYAHLDPAPPVASILGTRHYDFSDIPALSPLASQLGLKGPLNGQRVQSIINAYSLAFFNRYLKDQPTDLLNGPQPDYPELIWGVPDPGK